MKPVYRSSRIAAIATALAAAALTACSRGPTYSQATPDNVLESARLMIENGDARRLPDLIAADSDPMRENLRKLGVLLSNLKHLSDVLKERYPKQIDRLIREARTSSESGEASSSLALLLGSRNRSDGPRRRELFDQALTHLLADPFGWIQRGQDRLTTAYVTDDMQALLWDGKPILPPMGLVLRREGDRWYAVPPTNVPGVSKYMPHTQTEHQILGNLIVAFNNAIVDLRKDVEAGKAEDLEQVAEMAGERAFLPVMMIFVAYGKAMDARDQPGPS